MYTSLAAFLVPLLYSFSFARAVTITNNVCPTFKDYETIQTNKRCWYDFTADLKAPEIIKRSGYPLIEYKITTKDGYILTVFRIPNFSFTPEKKKEPVFILHGITCTCANFISLGNKSLAFLLANEGHDVWLGNYRGNEYSEGHINLTVFDDDYWDHSIHDIALNDIPAILGTIMQETKGEKSIIYIGHSLGTTMGIIFSSEFPEQAKRLIKLFIWISPSYKLGNMKSPYRHISNLSPLTMSFLKRYDAVRLVSQAEPSRNLVRSVCLESARLMKLCMQLANLFFGPFSNMGPEMVPVFFNQLPGGTGLKVYGSIARQIKDKFTKKDYGGWMNRQVYGTREPPEYDLSRIRVPTYIIYGVNDWATTKADAIRLYNTLPIEARFGIYGVNKSDFNHIDFVLGRDAKEVVYDHVIDVIKKFKKS